jgi:hypothetical protein
MIRNLIIAVVLVFLCASTAFAQLRVGEVTPPIQIPVCDTPEQAKDVLAHGKKGMKAFMERLGHYNRQLKDGVPACGMYQGQVAILEVVASGQVDDKVVTAIVVMVPEGHLFIGFTTLKVERGQST